MWLVFQLRQQCAYATGLHLRKVSGSWILATWKCHQSSFSPSISFFLFFFLTHSLCPVCVTCHMDATGDGATLMHFESMAWSINKTAYYSYVTSTAKLSLRHVAGVCLLFSEGRISGEYCFRASDRPWQWCIEVHVLSVSLINMRLPGGEQMAGPSSPPAGYCRDTTGISVGTAACRGIALRPGLYPTLPSHLAQHRL